MPEHDDTRADQPTGRDRRSDGPVPETAPPSAVSGDDLHDMGGDIGPAELSRRSPTPEVPPEDAPTGEPSARSPIGAGGTPYTAGPDARQPEIAQGPAEGIPREENTEAPRTTRSPIVSIDPDPGAAERTGAARRDRGIRRGDGAPEDAGPDDLGPDDAGPTQAEEE